MSKTLLIMAAGMGSRYGGLKQIDSVGPSGEYLIDYSVYDAIQAGFDKIVFVIRQDFAEVFRQHFPPEKFRTSAGNPVEIVYVYQELDDLPAGCELPPGRQKPWGTGHAVWSARDVIHEPFANITADDFYGRQAFIDAAAWMEQLPTGSRDLYGVVGYQLGRTLSPNGWVARGLLKADDQGFLTSIHEHTKIGWQDQRIVSQDKDGVDHELAPDRLVSMVFFAFTPDFFAYLSKECERFFAAYLHDESREFFTPNVVNDLIHTGSVRMRVLPTTSNWFGVTYAQDKTKTVAEIQKLIDTGVYPRDLWGATT